MEDDGDEHLEQPFKKRRGGQRQRLAVLEEKEASAIPQESSLASFLVSKWAWGFLSPQMVQSIAAKAKQDFKSDVPHHLERLANLGGGLENKMSQDMLSSHKSWLPLGFPVQLPYKKSSPFQKMLLPHDMFACIFNHYKGTFQNILCGAAGDLEAFWWCCGKHPALLLLLDSSPNKSPLGSMGMVSPLQVLARYGVGVAGSSAGLDYWQMTSNLS